MVYVSTYMLNNIELAHIVVGRCETFRTFFKQTLGCFSFRGREFTNYAVIELQPWFIKRRVGFRCIVKRFPRLWRYLNWYHAPQEGSFVEPLYLNGKNSPSGNQRDSKKIVTLIDEIINNMDKIN